MCNLKRGNNILMNDGINHNTYNLLFSDYYNLPKEEQGNWTIRI